MQIPNDPMREILRRLRHRGTRKSSEISSPLFQHFQRRASRRSEAPRIRAGPLSEFLGLTVSFRDDGGDVIASLTLFTEKMAKLVELAQRPGSPGTASLGALQKPAGKLRLAQTAAISGLGRAVLKPVFQLVPKSVGPISKGQ